VTFEEFLPDYLAAHSDRRTQLCHAAGTMTAVAILGAALVTRKPVLVPLALVAGYAPAWFSHWAFEHNQPKTFEHPFLSLRGDFVMLARVLTGKTA
jgi:hypothetical protein